MCRGEQDVESTPVGVESNPKYFNNMIVVVVEKLRGADCDCRLFSWPGSSFSPDLKLLRFSSPDRSHYSSSYQECVCGMTKGTVHPEDSAASEMEEGYRCITCQVLLLFAIIIEPGRCLDLVTFGGFLCPTCIVGSSSRDGSTRDTNTHEWIGRPL